MISVMNNEDLELHRTNDVVDDEKRAPPMASGDAVVDSSDKATNGGDKGARLGTIGSEVIRVLHGDVDIYDRRANLNSIESEENRVSRELDNRASESGNVRVLDGGVDFVANRGFEEATVLKTNEKAKSRASEMLSEDVKSSHNQFYHRDSGTENLKTSNEGDVSKSEETGHVESNPIAIDSKIWNGNTDVRNGKIRHSGLKAGNEHEVSETKQTGSHYDSMLSMFDEFAANRRGGVLPRPIGYGYEVGDMVWGKVKSHPWWPGHIYDEAFATPSVRRTKREGHVLVAFFGDSSYGWFDPAELVPFDINFVEKSKQTNSRTFVKAVEEAVDEASRRRGLGLACRCRNAYNFRPTSVEGYFAVDVGDYEPGAFYSVNQIKKARDSFQPRETLAFLKQSALTPMDNEHGSIQFIENKFTVLAYRKSVFEEFDDTYAQAFGAQPIRPSRPPPPDQLAHPSREDTESPSIITKVPSFFFFVIIEEALASQMSQRLRSDPSQRAFNDQR
ncbi:unnamed protein product [Ilex paraguariensis]|uniref:PWWP domain-containing protein n=1 Tax=Ilex paraguariensis TaxID=185542 RepID=A0ABC8T6E9_9AQUA